MFLSNSSSQSSSVDSSLDPNGGNDTQLNSDSNRDSLNRRLNMIISYGKEFVCMIVFCAFLVHASLQNSSLKAKIGMEPVPFFSKGSHIEEFFGGQLTPTQTKVSLSELTFVLYYSPWSSEFEHSRAAFEQVARSFHREAYFSAINCWQPGSECRNQYKKISSWPILMAYQRGGFGIQYQKNIWTEEALTKFVSSLLHPIERLITPDELLATMSKFEALVVAFLDMENDHRQYRSFYRSSIKFLEKDNFKEVGFAVVTGETALAFGVDHTPSIRAYMWNETLQYYGNTDSWFSRGIVKWITENLHQVAFNLSPPGTKAFSLTPYLAQGPLLILSTPRNFNYDSDIYIMLKQIGMEYGNCGGDNWVQEMARDYLFERRMKNREDYNLLVRQCEMSFPQNYRSNNAKSRCVASVSVSVSNVLNTSKNVDMPAFCELPKKNENCGYRKKETLSYLNGAKTQKKSIRTSMLDDSDSDASPEAILKFNFEKKCEMLKFAEKKRKLLFIDEYEDISPMQLISGLACKANKTINFISIDSAMFHTFAERLGVNVLESLNQTSVMIVDHENESTFLLDQPVNLIEISKFLYNYHHGSLTRFLRSSGVQLVHTHFFDFNEMKKVKLLRNNSILTQRKCQRNSVEEKVVTIQEINSKEFEKVVMKSKKTAVVFFFSANCAFCSIMQHSVLFMTRILKNMPDMEWFRIDGDKNDLPWQFTMSEYPSLVVFPAESWGGDETELGVRLNRPSRRYPSEVIVNNTNVLGFVLANLSRGHRLLGIVMACSKRHNYTNDCIETIQREITETISFFLRTWRKHPRKRSVILRLIRQLREIYLNLFSIKSSCDFAEIQNTIMSFLDRWLVATKL